MAYFIAAPVLLDSYNFAENLYKNKWSDEDTQVIKFAEVGEPMYKRLFEAKFDIKRALNNPIGVKGLLMCDYKTFTYP